MCVPIIIYIYITYCRFQQDLQSLPRIVVIFSDPSSRVQDSVDLLAEKKEGVFVPKLSAALVP